MITTLIVVSLSIPAANAPVLEELLGRWDLRLVDTGSTFESCWWKVEKDREGALKGQLVWRWGGVVPAKRVEFAGGEIRLIREEGGKESVYRARLVGGKLEGSAANADGTSHAFIGERAPDLPRARVRTWGKEIELIEGNSLAGWRRRNGKTPGWRVEDGVLACKAEADNDLVSAREFMDFKLHVEFNITKGGNSGVYLRGRYEVQLVDDAGKDGSRANGSIYGRLQAARNASRPAGEWQTLDVIFVGRMVTVLLNDEPIVENGYLDGITGGAMDPWEGKPGPVLLQGDHGDIRFRNIRVTPASREEKD